MELIMNTSCHIPLEILRKLPYESRIPENDEDDMELIMEVSDDSGWIPTSGFGYNCIGTKDCPSGDTVTK